VASHIALHNALYEKHNQQHHYFVGNRIQIPIEAAKSTKKSYAQIFRHLEQQQVFMSQINQDNRTKTLQHHRELKVDRK
jgi:hypothetical protein